MATDQMQGKAASVPKYEAVFEERIGRAVGRIRQLDIFAALLGLTALVMLYALLLACLDRWLELSALARQAMFLVLLLAVGGYLGVFVVWPLCRRVNPYYAARRLEQTIPESKNSVVNWLDLRHQQLPSAIRGAVGQRAAHDAATADLDQAISGRRTLWAGSATGILVVILLIALGILGPGQFWSLLGRAFAPFGAGSIRTRTQIELLQPANGDTTIPVGRSVAFAAALTGKVPGPNRHDSPRVLFRYRQSDPFEERPLEHEKEYEWVTNLPANQVHSGFWYKIAAGDAETPEYQVKVRSTPLVEKFDVTYHFRPYLGWRDETSTEPNLKALRGTEVTLIAHTNRTVKTGLCVVQGKDLQQDVVGERVAGDENAQRFKFVIERDGHYRIAFTSTDGETNPEPLPYTISALRDYAPNVQLKKPGQDIMLPANGLLQLEGSADDDIGVERVTLKMKLVDGPELQPKSYRDGKSFKLADGGYPKMLEYKDAVELDKLKDEQGKPVALQPKTVLEYWLEAVDACDYPSPNIGESKHYRVTVGEPDKDQKKQEEQRQKAQQEQKQHEQQQDSKLDKENEDRKQNGQGDKSSEPKQGDKGEKPEKNDGQQGDKDKPDPKADAAQDKLQKEFDQQDKKDDQKGDAKPDGDDKKAGPKDDGKGENQPQPGSGKDKGQPDKSEDPGNGAGQEGRQEPGQDKGEGAQQDGMDKQKGEDKGQGGGGGQQGQDKGDNKQQGEGGQNAGESKPNGQQGTKPEKATGKDGGEKGAKPEAAQEKDQGGQDAGQPDAKADAKGPGDSGQPSHQKPQGEAKADGKAPTKAESKGGDKSDAANGQPQGQPKGDGGAGAKEQGAKAEAKPEGANKGGGESTAKGDRNDDQKGSGSGNGDKPPKPKDTDQGNGGVTTKNDGTKPDVKPDSKPGAGQGSDNKPGEKAKPEDVARLAKEMAREDGKKQDDAAKQLAQAGNNAKDPKAREEARQALEQAGRDPLTGEPKPATAKNERKDGGQQQGNNAQQAETKGPPDKKNNQPGDAKSGDGEQNQAPKSEQKKDGQPQGTGDGSDSEGNPTDKRPPSSIAKGKGQGGGGKEPGQGTGGGAPGQQGGNESPAPAGGAANEPDRLKKSELLLERFDKLLEKDKKKFLEDAHLNEEDLKRLREDIARRKARSAEAPEVAPRATGRGTRNDRASTQVQQNGKARASDTQYGGPGSPPPEFRDVFREFTSGTKEKK